VSELGSNAFLGVLILLAAGAIGAFIKRIAGDGERRI
jgi:hypothetical protein